MLKIITRVTAEAIVTINKRVEIHTWSCFHVNKVDFTGDLRRFDCEVCQAALEAQGTKVYSYFGRGSGKSLMAEILSAKRE